MAGKHKGFWFSVLLFITGVVFLKTGGLAALQVQRQPESTQVIFGPIPPAFFGMHINRLSTPWPPIPFGSLRLFGDLTTWVHLEGSGRNKYDWRTLDSWLSKAREHDVELMYTFAHTPDWAASDVHGRCGPLRNTGQCSPPKDLFATAPCQGPLSGVTTTNCQFKEFVTSLLDHVCSGTAPDKICQIKAFSCWNEPNLDGFWVGTYAQSAKMCSDMVKTVKNECRKCTTLMPDISAATTGDTKSNGDSRSYNEWTRNFLLAYKPYANYPDAGAFHPYAARTFGVNPVPFPETFAGSGCPAGGGTPECPDTLPGKIATMRSLLDEGGLRGKPLWSTEGGWGTNGSLPDPDAQAAYVARWLILQASAGVARVYWYMWDTGRDSRGWGGMWDPQGGIHKAGIAYGQIYNWLVGAKITKPCAGNSNIWTCDISRAGGYRGRIIWDVSSSYDTHAYKKHSVGNPFAWYRDLNGGRYPIRGGTVMIGSKPMLLESEGPLASAGRQ